MNADSAKWLRSQKGFSLVELIVVVAIMAILMTGGLLSFSLVTGQQVKSCANEIDSCLGDARIQAMSKDEAYLILMVKNDGIYAETVVNGNSRSEKIGKSGVELSYLTDSARELRNRIVMTVGDSLKLTFDRSSGAFKPIEGDAYCTGIVIHGSGRTMQITLNPHTGKHSIENVSAAYEE